MTGTQKTISTEDVEMRGNAGNGNGRRGNGNGKGGET